MQEHDEAIERWLKAEVARTYDSVADGRTKTHPIRYAMDEIQAHHAKVTARRTETNRRYLPRTDR